MQTKNNRRSVRMTCRFGTFVALVADLMLPMLAACTVQPNDGVPVTPGYLPRVAIRLTLTDDDIVPSIINDEPLNPKHRIAGLWDDKSGRTVIIRAATWDRRAGDFGRSLDNFGYYTDFAVSGSRPIETETVTTMGIGAWSFGDEVAFRIPHCAPLIINGIPQLLASGQVACDANKTFWRRFGFDPDTGEDYVSGAADFYPDCTEEDLTGGWPYPNCPKYIARLQAQAVVDCPFISVDIPTWLWPRGSCLASIPWYVVVYADDVAPLGFPGSGYDVPPAGEPLPPSVEISLDCEGEPRSKRCEPQAGGFIDPDFRMCVGSSHWDVRGSPLCPLDRPLKVASCTFVGPSCSFSNPVYQGASGIDAYLCTADPIPLECQPPF